MNLSPGSVVATLDRIMFHFFITSDHLMHLAKKKKMADFGTKPGFTDQLNLTFHASAIADLNIPLSLFTYESVQADTNKETDVHSSAAERKYGFSRS